MAPGIADASARPGCISAVRKWEIAEETCKVSLGVGLASTFVGGLFGIANSRPHPRLFGIALGLQWSYVAGIFWSSRSILLEKDVGMSTTWAGGLSGLAWSLPQAVLAGSMRGVFVPTWLGATSGAVGQLFYNKIDAWRASPESTEKWYDSSWSPVSKLSDAEYKRTLQDKILVLDTEITAVDERIAAINRKQDESPNNDGSK